MYFACRDLSSTSNFLFEDILNMLKETNIHLVKFEKKVNVNLYLSSIIRHFF